MFGQACIKGRTFLQQRNLFIIGGYRREAGTVPARSEGGTRLAETAKRQTILVLPVGHSFNLSLPVSFTEFDSDSVRSQEAIARTYRGCAALSAAMRHARRACQRGGSDGCSQNRAGD